MGIIDSIIKRLFPEKEEKIFSLRQAKAIYDEANKVGDFNRREHALKKWNEFYLPILENDIATNDPHILLQSVSSEEMPPRGPAVERAVPVFNELVGSGINNIKTAKCVYSKFTVNSCNDLAVLVARRWEVLFVEKIGTIEDAAGIKVLDECIPPMMDTKTYRVLILKWFDVCKNLEEISAMKQFACKHIFPECSSKAQEFYRKVDAKTESFLFVEMPQADTIEKIRFCYENSPKTGTTKQIAFATWLSLCKTPEESNEAFKNAPNESLGKIACERTRFLTFKKE